MKGRHFQPRKGRSRGLLHDCKTSRNLREGWFEALVSGEVMSSISGIKTTSVGCSHQQPATGAGTLPMFSLSPPTAQPSPAQPSPAQPVQNIRCILSTLLWAGHSSQPGNPPPVCRINTRVTPAHGQVRRNFQQKSPRNFATRLSAELDTC